MLVAGIAIVSCKSQKEVQTQKEVQKFMPDEFMQKQIVFGNGGGFTGLETTFVLQQNGQLFKLNMDSTYTELGMLSAEETQKYFDKLEECKVKEVDFNNPGNMYFFLEEKEGTDTHRLVWGDERMGMPADSINSLHGQLIRLARDIKERAEDSDKENTEETK